MAISIAVSGKGGVGKTTVAALITKYIKENEAGSVLAVDADPDANLATVLGISVEQTIADLREETMAQMKSFPAGMSKSTYIQSALHQIIVETEKVDFLTMGRSEGPGCYCYINNLLRKFSSELVPAYDWMVLDNEAGLEHISRQTTAQIDHLIIVVNSTPLATDCARRIVELADELQNPIGRKYLLLNAVTEDRVDALRHRTADLGLEYLGVLPYDKEVDDALFAGRSLYELQETPAILRMCEIMTKIGECNENR